MTRPLVQQKFVLAEILPVRILDPARYHRFIAHIEGVSELIQPDQQSRRHTQAPYVSDVQRSELALKELPLNLLRALLIELLIQLRLPQMTLPLYGLTGSGLHREFVTFCKNSTAFLQSYPPLSRGAWLIY